jgi:uncharacterized repeat protein (TIGR03806 family)
VRYLLVIFFVTALSAQETPYGLQDRQTNTALLLDSPGYDLAPMQLELAFPNLLFSSSLHLTHADDGSNRIFVVERGGQIHVFANDRTVESAAVFIDLRDRVSTSSGEAGLLSIAFHPRFRDNGLFYLYYTTGNLQTRVSEFRLADDSQRGDPSSERLLLDIEQPAGNHNGGQIAFGPDGYLYIGLGDGGRANDVFQNGQDPMTLLGAILRIDVDNRPDDLAYAIPTDNPFDGSQDRRREIWAWGLRNPWRFSFDRLTGELWTGDVGQNKWEEIDIIVRGGNYGWNTMEGTHCFNPSNNCDRSGLILPVYEYNHDIGRSITGGHVYRGPRLVRLQGAYLYGDFVDKQVWGLRRAPDGQIENELLALSPSPIASFGEDESGEVYVVGFDGRIYRLAEKDDATPPGNIPTKLSASGLYQDLATRRIAPGIIPYSVNAPLWSDGARKERFIALPGRTQIGFSADAPWTFPAQTTFVKNFYLGELLVETRFMVKRSTGERWDGYSYMWDDDGRDATLLEDSATRTYSIDGQQQNHYFPSRGECLVCHTAAAGYALGVRTAQLNGPHAYAQATDNQLRTLGHIGLFTENIPPSDALPRLPQYDDEKAPVAARARAYLDATCAVCHRPGGTGRADMDLRFGTPQEQMHVVDIAPLFGDLELDAPRRLKPGEPENSILSARMRALNGSRMPPLASLRVDEQGAGLIERWIAQLGEPTAVLETQAQPTTFALGQNFPNPFNASTTIPYERTQDGPLSLAIYDVLGRRVRTLLANGHAPAGAHRATWDGSDQNGRAAASGLYFYRLQTTQHSQTRRMMLIR